MLMSQSVRLRPLALPGFPAVASRELSKGPEPICRHFGTSSASHKKPRKPKDGTCKIGVEIAQKDFQCPARHVRVGNRVRPRGDRSTCAEFECIQLLAHESPTHFIEVGPGKVLSGLNRQIDRALVTTNVEDQASLEKTLASFI